MEATLIVARGKASKNEVVVSRWPSVIGRSREAALTVAHPMVSRKHCELFEVDGLAMVRDLGSLNGTLIEGRRITEAPLLPGSEFSIGPLTFRIEYEYEGDRDSIPAIQYAESAEGEAAAAEEEVPDFTLDAGTATESGDAAAPATPAAEVSAEAGEEASFFQEVVGDEEPALVDDGGETAKSASPMAEAEPAETASDESAEDDLDFEIASGAAKESSKKQKPASQPEAEEDLDFEVVEEVPTEPIAGSLDAASEETIAEEPTVSLNGKNADKKKGSSEASSEEVEDVDPEAETDAAPAKKGKKGWWPFGKKEKPQEESKPAAKKAPEEPKPVKKPAEVKPAAATSKPAKKTAPATKTFDDFALDALGEGPEAEPGTDDGGDGLDDFFKKLK